MADQSVDYILITLCADSAVIACAERTGGRVLTLDRRDFTLVAVDADITIFPAS